jgi:hypothetical protein
VNAVACPELSRAFEDLGREVAEVIGTNRIKAGVRLADGGGMARAECVALAAEVQSLAEVLRTLRG